MQVMTSRCRQGVMYLIGITVFTAVFWWAIYNAEGFETFQTWIRSEIYDPDGEATKLKPVGIQTVLAHYSSPLHPWSGLGPGHTIDRLGGWTLPDSADLLDLLSATRTTVATEA